MVSSFRHALVRKYWRVCCCGNENTLPFHATELSHIRSICGRLSLLGILASPLDAIVRLLNGYFIQTFSSVEMETIDLRHGIIDVWVILYDRRVYSSVFGQEPKWNSAPKWVAAAQMKNDEYDGILYLRVCWQYSTVASQITLHEVYGQLSLQ